MAKASLLNLLPYLLPNLSVLDLLQPRGEPLLTPDIAADTGDETLWSDNEKKMLSDWKNECKAQASKAEMSLAGSDLILSDFSALMA